MEGGVWLFHISFPITGCLGPQPTGLQLQGVQSLCLRYKTCGILLQLFGQHPQVCPPALSSKGNLAKRPKDLFRSVTRHMYGLEVEIQWCLQLVSGWQLWPWFSECREIWCKAAAVVLCSLSPYIFLFSYLICFLIRCLWGWTGFLLEQVCLWLLTLFYLSAAVAPVSCRKWIWCIKPGPEAAMGWLALCLPALSVSKAGLLLPAGLSRMLYGPDLQANQSW